MPHLRPDFRFRRPAFARPALAGLTLLAGLVWCLGSADPAQAQGAGNDAASNFQLRLYINAYSSGQIDKTPQDPNGDQKAKTFGNDGASLELILYKRVGVSVSQDYQGRNYTDSAGNDVKERWISTYYNLTGYLKEAGKDRWNFFVGAGTGTVDRYEAEVNGFSSPPTDPARNLDLTRYFGGLEYAFQRIGFRAAYIQSQASGTISGQKLELNQIIEVLSIFVPFN